MKQIPTNIYLDSTTFGILSHFILPSLHIFDNHCIGLFSVVIDLPNFAQIYPILQP